MNRLSRKKMAFIGRATLLVLVFFVMSSWIIGIVLDSIDENIDRNIPRRRNGSYPPYPNDKFHHLHIFVQISDIHVSIFYDKGRITDFETFCTKYIDIIKPEVVIATGDLTDAKFEDKQGSTQFEEEWKHYHRILSTSNVTKKTVWLDLRGNHDAFDVPSLSDPKNLYKIYSNQGKKHLQSYRYEHKTGNETYTFVAVDSCPNPGPRRPFNFLGYLPEESMETLSKYSKESVKSNNSIWFGHYPTSTVVSAYPGLRKVMSTGAVYMCGHLHTLAGFTPRLHAMHSTGNLELELGDWKDNRIYRIFAFDHDLFSFVDTTFNESEWPVILVTNPKHAQYNMPKHEPTERQLHSTHIRVLAFSNESVYSVWITIDDVVQGRASHAEGPLFTLRWNPSDYKTGIHYMKVDVWTNHQHKSIVQPFSLDNEKIPFDLLPRLVILGNVKLIAEILFVTTWMFITLPLVALKYIKFRQPVRKVQTGCFCSPGYFVKLWLRRLHLLAQTPDLFYPTVLFAIYIAIGPWFVGEIMTDYIGWCFAFGIYVNGVLLPGDLTYVYGVFQLVTFNFPLILCLARILDRKLQEQKDKSLPSKFQKGWTFISDHGPTYTLGLLQIYMSVTGFRKAYGAMAFVLGPMRTWSIILLLVLHHRTMRKKLAKSHVEDSANKVNE